MLILHYFFAFICELKYYTYIHKYQLIHKITTISCAHARSWWLHLICELIIFYAIYFLSCIKQTILDYYTADEIHEAKRLLSNIESLAEIRMRQGDGRVEQKTKDIFLIINELDEKQRFSQLPMFVSDSAEKMPAIPIVSSDLKTILNQFIEVDVTATGLS